MFPPPSYVFGGQVNRIGWTMSEIDQMDVHFFDEMFSEDVSKEKEVYLSDVW